jgi:heme a synthase
VSRAASRSSISKPSGGRPSSPAQSVLLSSLTLPRCAWGVCGFNLLVILWGAFVRASKSGDGCGSHWPFCNGQVLPTISTSETTVAFGHRIIEYSHRFSSFLALVSVILLCIWVYRRYTKGNQTRVFAAWSVAFILIEAALGAGLVLFKLVAGDTSLTRAVYLSAHLTNTLLLIGSLTLTAWLASHPVVRLQAKSLPKAVIMSLLLTMLVCVSGAVAALGDTLFPAISVASGLKQDLSNAAPILLRLRLFHPLVAGVSGLTILIVALTIPRRVTDQPVREKAALVVLMILVQFALGVVNVTLLAPVWMQLVHPLASQILWICLLLFAAELASLTPSHQSTASLRV